MELTEDVTTSILSHHYPEILPGVPAHWHVVERIETNALHLCVTAMWRVETLIPRVDLARCTTPEAAANYIELQVEQIRRMLAEALDDAVEAYKAAREAGEG